MRAEEPSDGDAGRAALCICGEALLPDPAGTLWWPAEATLIVADLHLEKGSSHAERGALLPPYDTATTLARLERVIGRYPVRRVIALGDSFHDKRAGGRLAERDRAHLARLQANRSWIWIAGNHDPAAPEGVAGAWYEELSIGPLLFRHVPSSGDAEGEVAGHLHPVAKLSVRGRGMRRRCFAADPRRLILPAFGAFTGGLNVLDEAFSGLFQGRGFDAWMLGRNAVYQVAGRRLLA